eukprot:jgi/Undpi1/7098/HiC_scaffold_22.g09572.m1
MDGNAIRQGVYITAMYVVVFYGCVVGQAVAKTRLQKSYKSRGERFERYYNVTDKAMLAWDRIVGNLLEQAMPFLTLFWLNIGLAAINVTDYRGIAIAGWVYVVFRALYSAAWFAGGGGRGGPRSKILLVTPVMEREGQRRQPTHFAKRLDACFDGPRVATFGQQRFRRKGHLD